MLTDNKDELFPLVDEQGNITGAVTHGEANDGSKKLHPVVHLHVFNSQGELYMQKNISGISVEVVFDNDGEDVSTDELKEAFEAFEEELSELMLDDLIGQAAVELIEAVHQQDGEEDGIDEADELAEELKLVRITTYPDAFMLYFKAEKSFPGSEVILQLNEDYEIEDLIVEDE